MTADSQRKYVSAHSRLLRSGRASRYTSLVYFTLNVLIPRKSPANGFINDRKSTSSVPKKTDRFRNTRLNRQSRWALPVPEFDPAEIRPCSKDQQEPSDGR